MFATLKPQSNYAGCSCLLRHYVGVYIDIHNGNKGGMLSGHTDRFISASKQFYRLPGVLMLV